MHSDMAFSIIQLFASKCYVHTDSCAWLIVIHVSFITTLIVMSVVGSNIKLPYSVLPVSRS